MAQVRIQIEGFPAIHSEVSFVEMKPEDGEYEPLIGYIVLEQSQAGVDILGHRLVPIKHMDLKRATWAFRTEALRTTSLPLRQRNADSLEELPIPDWHREELERRLAAADTDPGGAIPWEEVRQRLRSNEPAHCLAARDPT